MFDSLFFTLLCFRARASVGTKPSKTKVTLPPLPIWLDSSAICIPSIQILSSCWYSYRRLDVLYRMKKSEEGDSPNSPFWYFFAEMRGDDEGIAQSKEEPPSPAGAAAVAAATVQLATCDCCCDCELERNSRGGIPSSGRRTSGRPLHSFVRVFFFFFFFCNSVTMCYGCHNATCVQRRRLH